ncbi:hypothetical protein DOTSEDRAFT_38192 [Dothistroma septosporum NZE10]|uniref:Ribosome assembly protein 3 n=1 Tax=Dothistroma septosporum (strain NZE10 / CBS 128990) TaxID=675120 RepID=N1PCI5_DOTSN|nr:hypothetical protein DOTSEDRAFT_38192 [Dothistroma septosporum NZE10]
MAPKSEEKRKRRNKRKTRTEVSSSSSSDSESSAASPAAAKKQKGESSAQTEPISDVDDVRLNEGDNAITVRERNPKQDPEKPFEEFYLQSATKEFANDLDKLRSAGDFNDRSVSMLIRSLRQGTKCFSKDERVRIATSLAD